MVNKNRNEYLEYLIETYSDTVYRLAMSRTKRKETSDDVYQEVFLRLAKKIPEFENEEHEKAWIIRVTINCSKNILGDKFAWHTVGAGDLTCPGTRGLVPLQDKTDENEIYYAVLGLPLKYRTVIYLFYYEGYKIEEISKILKVNENTVKSQLMRARNRLKINLDD